MSVFNAMVVHASLRRLGAVTVKDFVGATHIVHNPKHLVEIAREGDIVVGIIEDGVVVLTSVKDPLGNERAYPPLP